MQPGKVTGGKEKEEDLSSKRSKMARGLSREQLLAKNNAKTAAGNKGNQEAQRLQEKQKANEANKLEMLDAGNAAAVAQMEAKKAEQRAEKKERAANSTQAAKQNASAAGVSPLRGSGSRRRGRPWCRRIRIRS